MDKYVYIHLKIYKYRTIYLGSAPPPSCCHPEALILSGRSPKIFTCNCYWVQLELNRNQMEHHLHYSQSTEDRSSWVSSKIQDFCTREALDCLWMEAPPAK